jgi:hypothetical protein
MPVWNRDQLYTEVWEQPLLKVAAKYHISDVMLGKVCRTLRIPLPGRGYWARKASGQKLTRPPLPKVKNLPTLTYVERTEAMTTHAKEPTPPQPEPTDKQYLAIKDFESKPWSWPADLPKHKLVVSTEKALKRGTVDDKGRLQRQWQAGPCLDVHVSNAQLERALGLMNAVIRTLETEKFPVSVEHGKHGTTTLVFGQRISFSVVERYKEKSRHVVQESPNWSRNAIEYQPSGELEFRVDEEHWQGIRFHDRKKRKLEQAIPQIVSAMMQAARDRIVRTEQQRLAAIEQRKREIERLELSKQIEEEEKKVRELEELTNRWMKAHQMREFITALQAYWQKQGVDFSDGSERATRLKWMCDQADRLDPLVASPPSILDRKAELNRYW